MAFRTLKTVVPSEAAPKYYLATLYHSTAVFFFFVFFFFCFLLLFFCCFFVVLFLCVCVCLVMCIHSDLLEARRFQAGLRLDVTLTWATSTIS